MEPSQPSQPGLEAADGAGTQQPEAVPNAAERLREARARRRRAVRQVLLIGTCVVSLLCLGGVAAGFLYYHQATKPDLSTPEHVTRKYLEAYLIDRDEYKAREYRCGDTSGLTELQAFLADIVDRQKKYGLTFSFSVDRVKVVDSTEKVAHLDVDLAISTTDQGQPLRGIDHWNITTQNQDGWRVCTAHQLK
jgi:hypothetical protein